jgi:hypothetical protein
MLSLRASNITKNNYYMTATRSQLCFTPIKFILIFIEQHICKKYTNARDFTNLRGPDIFDRRVLSPVSPAP